MEDPGLKISGENGFFIVEDIDPKGVFGEYTQLEAPSRLVKLNGKDAKEFKSLDEIYDIFKAERKLEVDCALLK